MRIRRGIERRQWMKGANGVRSVSQPVSQLLIDTGDVDEVY